MNYVIAALVGLAWGALAAFVNSRITLKCLEKNTAKAITLMNLAHMAVDVAALAAVYFARKLLPFSFEATLIATAAALSIVTIIFTYKISYDERK